MTTLDQAYEMGAKGAEPTEAERLLFEAWMKGHCWMVHGDWDGKTYVHATERNGEVNYHTMHTRQLWAAWRDRAALAEQPAQTSTYTCGVCGVSMPMEQSAQQKPVAWMVDVDLANYQGQSEYRTILAWNAKPVWSGTHEINEVLKAVPLYTSPQPAQPAQQQEPVSEAWDKGYRQGVQDERTSEANIGIAGFGAKVEPARQNPYGTSPPAQRKESK